MKKRVLSGAALAGLLFFGAATLPQEPVVDGPPAQQAGPPSFRDVLRGKVGQECETKQANGIWTLSFPTVVHADQPGEGESPSRRQSPEQARLDYLVRQLHDLLDQTPTPDRAVVRGLEAQINEQQALIHNLRAVRAMAELPRATSTLTAVGSDFIQLREADGTERFVPLARVDVVVGAGR